MRCYVTGYPILSFGRLEFVLVLSASKMASPLLAVSDMYEHRFLDVIGGYGYVPMQHESASPYEMGLYR